MKNRDRYKNIIFEEVFIKPCNRCMFVNPKDYIVVCDGVSDNDHIITTLPVKPWEVNDAKRIKEIKNNWLESEVQL